MSEKCVCHINGYKVKDSTAREQINALSERVTNVENNAGGGGDTKLYKHKVELKINAGTFVGEVINDNANRYTSSNVFNVNFPVFINDTVVIKLYVKDGGFYALTSDHEGILSRNGVISVIDTVTEL